MPNPRLASRYAKSLVDLAQEQGQLEAVYADMLLLHAITKSSHEFVSFLRSPIIKADKKNAILSAITDGKVSVITAAFNKLLVNKGRESDMPEIIDAVIDQYYAIKGIHRVKLTTAVPVSDDVKNTVIAKVKEATAIANVDLQTVVDERLIGGFKLEFDNQLVDASVLYELNAIKKQFSNNDFVSNIR